MKREHVIAILKDEEGRYLVGKRPHTDPSPSLWEFPGGEPEDGETTERALKRKLREGLGIEVKILETLPQFTYTDDDELTKNLIPYECKPIGMPKRKYHSAIRWATIDEMKHYPFIAGNNKVISYLEKTTF